MRRFYAMGLAGGVAVAAACSSNDAQLGSGFSQDGGGSSSSSSAQIDASDDGAPGATGCCPAAWLLYGCSFSDGGAGLACHNPALGCASSLTCGVGCDSVVSGRCGDVGDGGGPADDAGASEGGAADAASGDATGGDAGDCCPATWDLYSCQFADGGAGMACHNPALGCASSLTCGVGCDRVVVGRCGP